MKTALIVTDCSANSACLVRHWLTDQTDESIRLTIVYPYDIEEGQALTKSILRPAKEEARARLKNWSAGLAWEGNLLTETVLASPELALTIYLLLRSYTYWLVEDIERINQFSDILAKTTTQPCWLSGAEVTHRTYEFAV
jgi:hypothetical protein